MISQTLALIIAGTCVLILSWRPLYTFNLCLWGTGTIFNSQEPQNTALSIVDNLLKPLCRLRHGDSMGSVLRTLCGSVHSRNIAKKTL
jgi:hypothetical protein